MVFGLVENHAARTIDDFARCFLRPVDGKAVHEERVRLCLRDELGINEFPSAGNSKPLNGLQRTLGRVLQPLIPMGRTLG